MIPYDTLWCLVVSCGVSCSASPLTHPQDPVFVLLQAVALIGLSLSLSLSLYIYHKSILYRNICTELPDDGMCFRRGKNLSCRQKDFAPPGVKKKKPRGEVRGEEWVVRE